MKQQITGADWDLATVKAKGKLREYGYALAKENFLAIVDFNSPRFTVGQLIQFLGDQWWDSINRLNPEYLCDELWNAVMALADSD